MGLKPNKRGCGRPQATTPVECLYLSGDTAVHKVPDWVFCGHALVLVVSWY